MKGLKIKYIVQSMSELATQEMKDRLASQGTEVRSGTPEALGTFISAEKTRWAQVIKESGIKFD